MVVQIPDAFILYTDA